jgi:ATPase family AAA domain-containing protein 3A/B
MSSKDSKGMYGFDATGLERAAKAAKLLDTSPNAKEAYELARKREETIELEHRKKIKYKLYY